MFLISIDYRYLLTVNTENQSITTQVSFKLGRTVIEMENGKSLDRSREHYLFVDIFKRSCRLRTAPHIKHEDETFK